MTFDGEPDFETLSAYVDGALDVRMAAEVATLVASDPKIAARVAKLHELKVSVANLVPDVVVLPRRLHPCTTRWIVRPALRAAAIAACLVCLVVAGGAVFALGAGFFDRQDRPLIASVVAQHDRWLASGRGDLLPVGLSKSENARLLSLAGLVQVHHDPSLSLDGVSMIHSGFVGSQGCRLSLFEVSSSDGNGLLNAFTASGAGLFAEEWANATGRFVVVARDMDATRFSVLAEALKRVTGDEATDEMIIAGLQSARQPCLS